MKKFFFSTLIVFFTIASVQAQESKYTVLRAMIMDGDTVPYMRLKEVEIYSLKIPKSRRAQKRLTKFVKNVKVVYPYAN